MEGAEERLSMSHDSGFRRNDHDSTHRMTLQREGASKASQHFEEKMQRRHQHHERLRKLLAERATAAKQEG